MRTKIAKDALGKDPFEHGLSSAPATRCFEARAPVRCIAREISQWVEKGTFTHPKWNAVEDGINTALIDWWLADPDFNESLDLYNDYVRSLEWELQEVRDVHEDYINDLL